MQVHRSFYTLPEIPFPVVTVGSFDGVHLGHRVIIKRLNSLAKAVGGESVLITFSPHPRVVLYPQTAGKNLKMINTLSEKCQLLEETGLDHLVIVEFTKDFARTTSDEFISNYLVGKLKAHTIVVGFNHFFGHNKEGSYASLYQAREKYGYRVEEIPEQEILNETVSSTKIRKALSEGNIQRANAYLERFFVVHAQVDQNNKADGKRGCTGFVIRSDDPLKLFPPQGAYAISYQCQDHVCKGVVQVKDSGNLLFPLESGSCMDGGEINLYFHKQIQPGEEIPLPEVLDRVRELIY